MARIRTIKPKFWDDVKIGKLSRDARLLYIGMWNFADDLGVIIADPQWIKSKIFPFDQLQLQQLVSMLNMLEKNGFISHFSHKGENFYYLPTFSRHQVINKPNVEDVNVAESDLQHIVEVFSHNHGTITEQSRNNTVSITEQSVPIKEEELIKEKEYIIPHDEKKIESLKNNKQWLESVAMKFSLLVEDVIPYIDLFANDCRCTGEIHSTTKSVMTHFTNWLRIQLSNPVVRKHQQENKKLLDNTTDSNYRKFLLLVENSAPTCFANMVMPTIDELNELKKEKSATEIADIIKSIENDKFLREKRENLYLTIKDKIK